MSGGDFSSSLEGLTVAELVDKKGSVEHEIKQFSDVLETVSPVYYQYIAIVTLPTPYCFVATKSWYEGITSGQ